MPQLEKQDSQLQWLPGILEASVDVVVEKVVKNGSIEGRIYTTL